MNLFKNEMFTIYKTDVVEYKCMSDQVPVFISVFVYFNEFEII